MNYYVSTNACFLIVVFCLFLVNSSVAIRMVHAETTGNLLANPGFEEVNLSNWPLAWGGNSASNCASDDQAARPGGSRSLRISLTEPSSGPVWVAQGVQVKPGGTYNLGAWIKSDNVSGNGAQVFIEWLRPDGGWYGGNWGAPQVTGTGDWQYAGDVNVLIPPDAGTNATVFVALLQGSTGTAWFDDVTLERVIESLMQTDVIRPNYAGNLLPGAPSPEIRLNITLNAEDNGFALNELSVRVALRDPSGAPVANGERPTGSISSSSFIFDLDIPDDLPLGDYDLVIGVYEGQDLLSEQIYPLRKVSGLTSYVDSYGRFVLNGEPFFPIGLYVVQCTNGSYSGQLDEITDSPFDTLMNYAVNRCGSEATDGQILGYLNQLETRDLKLIFSFSEYFDGGQADIDAITQKVNTFKGHPAVISWYLNDERDPSTYLAQLEARYGTIRALDENHPVWSVHWNTTWLIQEAHTTDIVGMDSYPIDNLPITVVGDVADAAVQTGKPLWLVPQIFSWTDYPGDFRAATGRHPTKAEMRATSYLAVNHGAKGLIYYSYFNILDDVDIDPDPEVDTSYEARWPQIKDIAGEMDRLKSVFLSIDTTDDNDVTCNNSKIDLKLMRTGHAHYLLAVNVLEETIAGVSFENHLPTKPEVVDLLFEDGRQIATSNGGFTDNFDPYDVHVYVWTQHGDISCDGSVDLTDAILTFQAVAGFRLPVLCASADVGGDGKIGLGEALYILQYVVGLR